MPTDERELPTVPSPHPSQLQTLFIKQATDLLKMAERRRLNRFSFIHSAIRKFKTKRDKTFKKELQSLKANIFKTIGEHVKKEAKKNGANDFKVTSLKSFEGPSVGDIIWSNTAEETRNTNKDQTQSASQNKGVPEEDILKRKEIHRQAIRKSARNHPSSTLSVSPEVKIESEETTEIPIASRTGDSEPVVEMQVKVSPENINRIRRQAIRRSPRNHNPLSLLDWPTKSSKSN